MKWCQLEKLSTDNDKPHLFADAIQDFEKTIETNPGYQQVDSNQGITFVDLNKMFPEEDKIELYE